MRAGKYRILAALLTYLVFFGITIRLFIEGHHLEALSILIAVWLVIAVWIWRAR